MFRHSWKATENGYGLKMSAALHRVPPPPSPAHTTLDVLSIVNCLSPKWFSSPPSIGHTGQSSLSVGFNSPLGLVRS
ncbi:hypothetical protein Y1Q_0002237 [Alligator mississippiensis]|uniref:Uncharacterized protein n=1 Tax=Alligator mississippiensis TaxID=8496 RepID=A0A151MGF8_ALLMI|nr:hypothetical protein Y1Q_0002237 [Alligator mississippiensis]